MNTMKDENKRILRCIVTDSTHKRFSSALSFPVILACESNLLNLCITLSLVATNNGLKFLLGNSLKHPATGHKIIINVRFNL